MRVQNGIFKTEWKTVLLHESKKPRINANNRKLGHRNVFLSFKCSLRLHTTHTHTYTRGFPKRVLFFYSFDWLCRFARSFYRSLLCGEIHRALCRARIFRRRLSFVHYKTVWHSISKRFQVSLNFWSGKTITTTLYACLVFVLFLWR